MAAARILPELPGTVISLDDKRNGGEVIAVETVRDGAPCGQSISEQAKAFKADVDGMLQKHCQEMHRECEQLWSLHFDCELLPVAKLENERLPKRPRSLPPVKCPAIEPKNLDGTTLDDSSLSVSFVMPESRRATRQSIISGRKLLFEQETSKRYAKLLRDAFKLAEDDKKRPDTKRGFYLSRVIELDWKTIEFLLDSVIGFFICLNALILGFQMDADDPKNLGWFLVDAAFSCLYIFEVGLKVRIHGCRRHFGGEDSSWHCFDALLIFIDLIQMMLNTTESTKELMSNTPSAGLFRVIRVAKITRVLRLLRSEFFKDLLMMMQGMIGGSKTLGWSIILFLFVVYVVALIFREFFGRATEQIDNVSEMFDSVPRSMYTTFRCSFGDCSTPSGVPIFEHVIKHYVWIYTVIYCLFVFVVTIGIMNVISAIFLESTMAAATRLENEKKQARLTDHKLWLRKTATLVQRLTVIAQTSDEQSTWKLRKSFGGAMEQVQSLKAQDIQSMSVPWHVINSWSKDQQVQEALEDLDIDQHDTSDLHDILDPDNNGSITLIELLDGLRRLRGFTRRGDILTVDLMVRSVQQDLQQIFMMLEERGEAKALPNAKA